jgi:NADPH-dependent 2,4-dienoyl-CoA reductase/sulfur reductase-like enzyme
MSAGVVIAGAGLAAQRCAEALRRSGYEQRVVVVGDEHWAPYDRPPLSKALLAGELEPSATLLRPAGWHAENGIELLLGDRARAVDATRRRLRLSGGGELPYEHLVIATGSRPRRLPGAERFANSGVLRTLDDAIALRASLKPGTRLTVLGAGLIGQEVAATARAHGARVTLVEAEPLPLARALHPELARWLIERQRSFGVEVRLGAAVASLDGDGDTLRAIALADGARLPTDRLLMAIGVQPNDEWLGAPLRDLVRRPEIHAAGDVAGGDHWERAAWEGRAVATAILGREATAAPATGWWSEIHGVRLQGLGNPAAADTLEIEGDQAAASFTAVASRAGRAVAALAVGRPRDFRRLRALIHGQPPSLEEAA